MEEKKYNLAQEEMVSISHIELQSNYHIASHRGFINYDIKKLRINLTDITVLDNCMCQFD